MTFPQSGSADDRMYPYYLVKKPSYFNNKEGNYKLECLKKSICENAIDDFDVGACDGVWKVSAATSSSYDFIDNFFGSYKLYVSFWRGINQSRDIETETCVETVVQRAVDGYEANSELTLGLSLTFGITGGAALICTAMLIYFRYLDRATLKSTTPQGMEENRIEGQPLLANSSSNDATNKVTSNSVFKPRPVINYTFEQRLAAIGIDPLDDPDFEDFICSVTGRLMQHPAKTDDGKTYEKSALEELKARKANCPLDRTKKVKNIIDDTDTRRAIIKLVEEKEKLAGKKKMGDANNQLIVSGKPRLNLRKSI